MNKPVGVVIIAVLQALAALLSFVGAVLLGAAFLSSVLHPSIRHLPEDEFTRLSPMLFAFAAAAFVICFVFAIFWAFVGWGMWSLKNWARIATIVVCCLGIGFAVLASLSQFYPPLILLMSLSWPPFLAWQGVRVAVCALVIWYLLQARVRAVFNGRPRVATA
jgi:hypothetical protein